MKRKRTVSSRRRSQASSSVADKRIQEQLNIPVPHSLVAVAPFLEEGLHVLRQQRADGSSCFIAQSCFTHAFAVLEAYDIRLDAEALESIIAFKRLSEDVCGVVATAETMEPPGKSRGGGRGSRLSQSRHRELIIAQALASAELAERELASGLVQEAGRLFHTACVYLRMCEPLEDAGLRTALGRAAARARECGLLGENFVLEHFTSGARLAHTYEELPQVLGRGNFGSVAVCVHRHTRDRLAKKEVRLRELSPYQVHLLHSEIAIMKQLDHPNIVKLKEVFFETKCVYLVMELCAGGDLQTYIRDHGCQSERVIAMLLRDMISSVMYLHEKGVVHRDIKLQNFMFETAAPDAQLKLIDFGLSKHFDESELMVRLVGTPYYIAPEVWGGRYDQRCDVWSLGVCAYIMLFGALPFEGADLEDVRGRITAQEPSYRGSRRGISFAASPLAVDLLRRLLRKSPADRPALSELLGHAFLTQQQAGEGGEGGPEERVAPAPGLLRGGSSDSQLKDSADSLIRFLNMSATKRLLLRAVAFCLSAEQIARLRTGFEEMDADRSGTISLAELRRALQSAQRAAGGSELSKSRGEEADEQEEFLDFDLDLGLELEEAEINYSEFLAAAIGKQLVVEEGRLKMAFQRLDLEGRGYLTRAGLALALGRERSRETGALLDALVRMDVRDARGLHNDTAAGHDDQEEVRRKVDAVFADLDFNHDGKIEFYEFLRYWREFNGLQPSTHTHASPSSSSSSSSSAAKSKSKFSSVVRKIIGGLAFLSRAMAGRKSSSAL